MARTAYWGLATVVIIGLYLLLWGKEEDQQVHGKEQEQSKLAYDEQKELMVQLKAKHHQAELILQIISLVQGPMRCISESVVV